MSEQIDELVNRFLAWNLPKTVCADLCATNSNYPHSRSGTNLLTADEARQMLAHVLMKPEFVGVAWLIETDDPHGNNLYYCGPGDWCSNPNHAMRFVSEQCAVNSEHWREMQYPGNLRIAEHEWVSP